MSTLDITNLKGNDLLKAITSGKKLVVNTEKTNQERTVVHYAPFLDHWKKESVVFITQQVVCKGCGSIYEFPNQHIMLKESHKSKGTHYRALTEDEYIVLRKNYPLVFESHQEHAMACASCVVSEFPVPLTGRS